MPYRILSQLLVLIVAATWMAGCDNGPAPYQPPVLTNGGEEKLTHRVVSLSPSLTKMIIDMGREKSVVGVAANDPFAPAKAVVVGTATQVSQDALLKADPTHVLLIADENETPASLSEMAKLHKFKLISYVTPLSVDDVWDIIVDSDDITVSETGVTVSEDGDSLCVAVDAVPAGMDLRTSMISKLDAMSKLKPGFDKKRTRVLVISALKPKLVAVGPKTALSDVMTTYVGIDNAAIPVREIPKITDPKKIPEIKPVLTEDQIGRAPEMNEERLLATKADVIVLMIPGADALKSINEDPRLEPFRGLKIPAVENNRFVLISEFPAGSGASSLIPRVAAALAKAAYPENASKFDAAIKSETPEE